jgi:hypothetical protein
MEDETPREQELRRRYRRHIFAATLGYVAVLAPVAFWGGLDGTSPWRFVFAALPLLPAAWMFAVIVRRFRELDEYQLRLAFPGVGAGLAAAMLSSVTFGFLSLAGLAMPLIPWLIVFIGGGTWRVVNQITGAAKQF